MTDDTLKVNAAMGALFSRDTTAYREARRAYHQADLDYRKAGMDIATQGAASYRVLEGLLAKALSPHTIEWKRYGQPSEMTNGGGDVNHDKWVTMVHLAGEVSPHPEGGRYNMHARMHIPFSITPRTGAEFWKGVQMLKAMADAATKGGL